LQNRGKTIKPTKQNKAKPTIKLVKFVRNGKIETKKIMGRNEIMKRGKRGFLATIIFVFPWIHGYFYCTPLYIYLLFLFSLP
jgi:hypothetical protein